MTEEEQKAMKAASDKSTQKLSAKAQQIKEKNEKQAVGKLGEESWRNICVCFFQKVVNIHRKF